MGERLIVEDFPDFQEQARNATSNTGLTPVVEGTVAGGLARLEADTFTDVLTDMGLPDGSGNKIVEAAAGKGIPVIVWTAEPDQLTIHQRIWAERSYDVVVLDKSRVTEKDLLPRRPIE